MDQIRLGGTDWLDQEMGDEPLVRLLGDDASDLFDEVCWDDDTKYDKGWQRAGGESFYRVGRDRDGTPYFIQKSGNPRKTVERGQRLDEAGGVVIPTIMLVEPDARNDQRISGTDYTIVQDHVPETFTERYRDDRVTRQAIEDLGRNAAALDAEGFRPTQPERQLNEMLSDGAHTYLVDFGGDIGPARYDAADRMYQACLEELDENDLEAFRDGYHAVREYLPDEHG